MFKTHSVHVWELLRKATVLLSYSNVSCTKVIMKCFYRVQEVGLLKLSGTQDRLWNPIHSSC